MAGNPTTLNADGINFTPVSAANPLPVSMTTGGSANSLTNPIFVANAEAGDTTGTFTNGTQTTSVTATNCDGYATALVSINGTYGTATAVFEASDDGGATWYSIGGSRSDGLVAQTGYTSQTNASIQWACPISGNDSFRVRSTAVASGTVNVRISVSSIVTLPPTSVVTGAGASGATAVGNPVFVAGWDGTSSRGLLTDGNGRLIDAPQKSGTGTPTQVASSATAVTILASNAARLGGSVVNDSTAILYLILSATTPTTAVYTVALAAKGTVGSYYEIPFGYTGIIQGIWATANGNAVVTQYT